MKVFLYVVAVYAHITLVLSEYWTVTVHTCDKVRAGTDSSISITIYGPYGYSEHGLSGSFDRDSTDTTHISTSTLGKPYTVKVRHGGGGWFSGWCLDWVRVYTSQHGTVTFRCGCDMDGVTKTLSPDGCNDGFVDSNCVSHYRRYCFYSICNRCSNSYWLDSDRRHCRKCPYLADCIDTRCTGSSKSWCLQCRDDSLFKLDSNQECKRRCTWDNRWCWPGKCQDDYASQCTCASDFRVVKNANTARCEPANPPKISTCRMEMEGSNGEKIQSPFKDTSACSNQQDVYGKFQISKIAVDTNFYYPVNFSDTEFPVPPYVKKGGYRAGVTDVIFDVVKKHYTGEEEILHEYVIKADTDSEHPVETYVKKEQMLNTYNNGTLRNGDRMCVRFKVKGGGYFESLDLHTRDHNVTHVPYTKTSNHRDLCYFLDNASPDHHCSDNRPCSNPPLQLSHRVTRTRNITITFLDWFDPSPVPNNKMFASGIKQYELTIYEVVESGLHDLDLRTEKVTSFITNSTAPMPWTFPESAKTPVLYSIVLEVTDIAENVHQARRFVLFDNCSDIRINQMFSINVTSAAIATDRVWQVNHHELCFDWRQHFYNDYYILTNLLKPIKQDKFGFIKGNFDQIYGDLSINGTTNVDGITSFSYVLKRNGLEIITKPSMENFTTQRICLSVPSNDGDTFELVVKAMDIVNNTLNDSVVVHIDSTVPEINNVWLVRGEYKGLYVHHSTELSSMKLAFRALDPHSGIHTVKWSFGTTAGGAEIENGTLAVASTKSCNEADNSVCYCPDVGQCQYMNYTISLEKLSGRMKGLHNRRYFFRLEVTNEALLKNYELIDILVDDSPPNPGTVSEGPLNGPDIDYSSMDTVIVHWHGFIDHESGIKSYRLAVGRKCLTSNDIKNRSSEYNITDTSSNEAKITIYESGKYYMTVIAYNNAMEPSIPVCSDGVTIDHSPPMLRNITLLGASTSESVVCSDGSAWFIHGNISAVKLDNSTTCRKRCRNSKKNEFLALLPIEDITRRDEDISEFLCSKFEDYNDTLIYLPSDRIYFEWDTQEDMSQIYDVYIGFGSTKKGKLSPDLIGYDKARHGGVYSKYNLGISHGTEMFAFFKTINKAGLETISTYGPILVDETPPVCPGIIHVKVDDRFATIFLAPDLFIDNEQREDIGSIYFRIGSDSGFHTAFLQWLIHDSPVCDGNRNCIRYPVSRLQTFDRKGDKQFFFQLHVYNYAGHFCTVNTEKFMIPSKIPPPKIIVKDISPEQVAERLFNEDVDVTVANGTYCASWFSTALHFNTTFEIGLGLSPGMDDIEKFHRLNHTSEYYCGLISKINEFDRFFVSIRASCRGGTSISSSDGFVVVGEAAVVNSIKVSDGKGCANDSKILQTQYMKNGIVALPSSGFSFYVGRAYTMKVSVVNEYTYIVSKTMKILKSYNDTDGQMFTFIALDKNPTMSIKNCSSSDINTVITISSCLHDIDYMIKGDELWSHWTIDKSISPLITHLKVALLQQSENVPSQTSNSDVIESGIIVNYYGGNRHKFQSRSLTVDRKYVFQLTPCSENYCFKELKTDGFRVTSLKPEVGLASAHLLSAGQKSSLIKITFSHFRCTSGNHDDVWYRWALFSEHKPLTNWDIVTETDSKNKSFNVEHHFDSPIYLFASTSACIEGYCTSGASNRVCVPVDHEMNPNIFDKRTLYEVDIENPGVKRLRDFVYSANIGSHLSELHDIELDFSRPRTRLGAMILGLEDRNVTWYVRSNRDLKDSISCSLDSSCIISVESVGGYISFPKANFKEGTTYYICADVRNSSLTREKTKEFEQGFSVCGDGILIDDSPPTSGTVRIISDNGYIVQRGLIGVEWKQFRDMEEARKMGYPSNIASYKYFIGSYPFGDDITPATDAGLSTNVLINTTTFVPGKTYYATVSAYDHVGLTSKATSEGVTYDDTPPLRGPVFVGGADFHRYVTSTSGIPVHWTEFKDEESGIKTIEVGIGSFSSSVNVIPFVEFTSDYAFLQNTSSFHDGNTYYAIIKVTNRAGLATVVSSEPFMIDGSKPDVGVVHDGVFSKEDVDYQLNTTHIGCNWSGFTDPHSGISDYKVGLGTKPGDDDVRRIVSVGYKLDAMYTGDFVPGTRYYCKVQACNEAGLCSTLTSNGVVIDNSPPIPGLVHVGTAGKHSKYIAHTTTLHAQWIGFQDPHSDISHFSVCIGRNKSCDIMPFTNFLLSSSMIKTGLSMPENEPLFVTVKAFNKAGLYIDQVSDSFIVVTKGPVNILPPEFDTNSTFSSRVSNIQFDPSLLKLKWKFEDHSCPIVRQVISLRTHHDGHTPIESIEVGAETAYIQMFDHNTLLRSGDVYQASVTACNQAGICSSAHSSDILIDSTPPHLGGFKPPMKWSNSINHTEATVFLTWYGFVDIESGIDHYYLSVGDTYSDGKLSGVVSFAANNDSNPEQSANITLNKAITKGQKLVLTIWSINKAGLVSAIGKVTVHAIASDRVGHQGQLIIEKHSCNASYCTGDCTCAVVGKKCIYNSLKSKNCPKSTANVTVDIKFGLGQRKQNMTSSLSCLSAFWTSKDSSNSILRYEWSIGSLDADPGVGIFNLSVESAWRDNGKLLSFTYCLPDGKDLMHGSKYVAYIRAWTSFSSYEIFRSSPILVDRTPPAIRRGHFVKDSNEACKNDFDYINYTDKITICFNSMFIDEESGIVKYIVKLGTSPGGDDVIANTDNGLKTKISFGNLNLTPGTKYYASVTALNHIGLNTISTSDGFVADLERPYPGVVFNTNSHVDKPSQSSTDIGVSFHGFEDHHSHIKWYMVALKEYNSTAYIVPFHSVGIRNSLVFRHAEVTHSLKYMALVKAVDAAGHESPVIMSHPILIDVTPPVGFQCQRYETTLNETLIPDSSHVVWKFNTSDMINPFKIKILLSAMKHSTKSALFFKDTVSGLTFMRNADGTFLAKERFVKTQNTGNDMLKLHIDDFENGTEISINVKHCTNIVSADRNVVKVKQISSSAIKVALNVYDLETGIRNVYAGVGTTERGLQIQPYTPSPSSGSFTIDMDINHGTPIYITVAVENTAGGKTVFASERLIFDHTPPIVTDIKANININASNENQTLTRILVHWNVIDNENGIKHCECGIGNTKIPNIVPWEFVSNKREYASPWIFLEHGTKLIALVRCINHIELSGQNRSHMLTIAYKEPEIYGASMKYIKKNPNSITQRRSSPLIIGWKGFQDNAGILKYECRVLNKMGLVLLNWTNVGQHNYAMFNHAVIALRNEYAYTAEVRAVNVGGVTGPSVNSTIIVHDTKPQITGRPATYTMQKNKVHLDWGTVFRAPDTYSTIYTVSAGTKRGYTDILRNVETMETTLDFTMSSKITEMYVVVRVTSDSDLVTTYSQRLN